MSFSADIGIVLLVCAHFVLNFGHFWAFFLALFGIFWHFLAGVGLGYEGKLGGV